MALASKVAFLPSTAMITGHVPAVHVPLTTRLTVWLRLARHEEAGKTAEILILRHLYPQVI